MKKRNSFFVKMEPPKKHRDPVSFYPDRSADPTEREIRAQETGWQRIIDASSSAAEDPSERSGELLYEEDYSADRFSEETRQVSSASEGDLAENDSEEPIREETVLKKTSRVKQKAAGLVSAARSIFPIVRLAAASLLFAAAVVSGHLSAVSAILLAFSAILAGLDVLIRAVRSVMYGNFREPSVIVSFVAITSYAIGFRVESAALMILVPIGERLISILKDRVNASALKVIDSREPELIALTEQTVRETDSDFIFTETVMTRTLEPLLSLVMILAAAFAVIVPIVSYYRTVVSVHRAITVILVCTPVSVLCSFPCIGRYAQCYSASHGIVFRNAFSLEHARDVRTFVLDKSGLFDSPEPAVERIRSVALDENTFKKLVFHVVRNSSQNFAITIADRLDCDYDPSLVTDFTEAPGGMTAKIGNMEAVFGMKEYVEAAGLSPPSADASDEGMLCHLFLSGRYGGNVLVSIGVSTDISDIIHDLRLEGMNKCILISDDSREEIADFAERNHFDVVYAGIGKQDKYELLHDICMTDSTRKLILTADPEVRSESGDTVIFVGDEMHDADAVVPPHLIGGICSVTGLSARIQQIAYENAVIAVIIKAVVIFFSLIGYCNIWMAITADIAAALITILNSLRVGSGSLLRTFMEH